MTRWPNLYALLTGETGLSEAQKARQAAAEAVTEAENRNDDRDLGRARMILTQATHDELRAVR